MICLVTSSLNRCHCGKLQCFFENGTPFFKRTSYVYEIESILYRKKKKKFKLQSFEISDGMKEWI